MVSSLRSREIDVGIGLTEGWIAGLGRKKDASTGNVREGEGGYSLVGQYVESPLCWAISTGLKRDFGDKEGKDSLERLRGRKMGVSRIGSGSYVMGFVLADQEGWLESSSPASAAASGSVGSKFTSPPEAPFSVHPLQTFAGLREAVNNGTADFFMWEYFTSKRYYSPTATHPLKQIGEIYTPWPSWQIVAADSTDGRLEEFFEKVNQGVEYFQWNQGEAVEYISTQLDYEEEDARKWLGTVQFAGNIRGVRPGVVRRTVEVLVKAGVLAGEEDGGKEMIGIERAE